MVVSMWFLYYFNSSQFQISKEEEERHRRIILKNGHCNVSQPQTRREKVYILEFLKLVDYSWTFSFILFSSTLLLSWFAFAVLYWIICYTHGDLEPDHLPPLQKQNNYRPCLYDVHNFASCFMFSIETQHTLVYGVKATTDECPEAIFVNSVQCLVGFIMQGIMAVTIFYKMTLPRQRQKTLLFSKYAAVCCRDGRLCIMFRIGDMRMNDMVAARIRSYLLRTTRTLEGESLINHQQELTLLFDDCNKGLFFYWPLTIYHIINKDSPLYYFSPRDLARDTFEIVIVLEGTIESTGQMTQHRTSYMSNEILWGRKFEPLLKPNQYRQEYDVDLSKFDNMLPVKTPLCSAAYCEEFSALQNTKLGKC